MKKITVFTPTYNRAYTLPKLYESLVGQTCNDFEWLIVDDGSTDNTHELVESWTAEKKIDIRYFKQENSGKSSAHNKGAQLTQTPLFTCVDSDDYLTDDAIEKILLKWNEATDKNIGILVFRQTTQMKKQAGEATLNDAYNKFELSGDTFLIFRTDVVKRFFFPEFEGERFVPEGYLYDLIDTCGTLLILPERLYRGDYLEDGYTKNMAKLLKNNPNGYMAFIEQRLKFDKTFKARCLDTIRYLAMAMVIKRKKKISGAVYPAAAFFMYPFGYIFFCRRYKNI